MVHETPPSPKQPKLSDIQRLLWNISQKVWHIVDRLKNGRTLKMFEAIIVEIIATQRVYQYDTTASYYTKLLSLVDIEDDIELVSNNGSLFLVKDYPHITFTRKELDAMWDRYTQLKYPELSEEFA
jgi:hypothetical protein